MKKLKVLELFAGTRSIGRAFEKYGHEVYSVEWDKVHDNIDWYVDISKITAEDILERFGKPDVIWASPDCFTAGTLVATPNGYAPIEELKVGDYVLTHKGRYRKIYATMNSETDTIHEIKIAGTETIETTPEHPFLARKKKRVWDNERRAYTTILGEPEWVNAEDLTKDYRVQKNMERPHTNFLWEGVNKTFRNQFGTETLTSEDSISNLWNDEYFWWLMGYFVGDGSVRYDEEQSRYQFEVCCRKESTEQYEIKQVLSELPFNYVFMEKDTTNVFAIHQKELAKFVTLFGGKSKDRYIPDFVFELENRMKKSFLEGYLASDGSTEMVKGKHENHTITTVSPKLAYTLSELVYDCYGVFCSITKSQPRDTYINGRKIKGNYMYSVSWYTNPKKSHYTAESDSLWVNVRGNKIVNKKETVYNISVEEDETYVVFGVTVHNCTTYSIAAISHHRIKSGDDRLPKSEKAKFADETNQNVLKLIKELDPKYYFIENPRGTMRKMSWMQDLPRYTLTYCKYGDSRMKPTDIWTNHPDPKFKPMCKNGDPCHTPAPRGSKTGTQGIKCKIDRSRIPDELCEHIVKISEE